MRLHLFMVLAGSLTIFGRPWRRPKYEKNTENGLLHGSVDGPERFALDKNVITVTPYSSFATEKHQAKINTRSKREKKLAESVKGLNTKSRRRRFGYFRYRPNVAKLSAQLKAKNINKKIRERQKNKHIATTKEKKLKDNDVEVKVDKDEQAKNGVVATAIKDVQKSNDVVETDSKDVQKNNDVVETDSKGVRVESDAVKTGNTKESTVSKAPQKANGPYSYKPINAALNSHLREININKKVEKELKAKNNAALAGNVDTLTIDDRVETGNKDIQAESDAAMTGNEDIQENIDAAEIRNEGIQVETDAAMTDNGDIQGNHLDVSGVEGNIQQSTVGKASKKANGPYSYNPINAALNSHLQEININEKVEKELKAKNDAALTNNDDTLTIDDHVEIGNKDIQAESDAAMTDNEDVQKNFDAIEIGNEGIQVETDAAMTDKENIQANHDGVSGVEGNTKESTVSKASTKANVPYSYNPINAALNSHLREINVNEKVEKELKAKNDAALTNNDDTLTIDDHVDIGNKDIQAESDAAMTDNEDVQKNFDAVEIDNEGIQVETDAAMTDKENIQANHHGVTGVEGNTKESTVSKASKKANGPYSYNPINAALNSHLREININEKVEKELKAKNDAALTNNADTLTIDDHVEIGNKDIQAESDAAMTDNEDVQENIDAVEIDNEGIQVETDAAMTDKENIQANHHGVTGVEGNTKESTVSKASTKANGPYSYNPINAALNSHLREINVNEKVEKELKANNDPALTNNDDTLAIDDRVETGNKDIQAQSDAAMTDNEDFKANNAVVTGMDIEPRYGAEEIVGEGIPTEIDSAMTDNKGIEDYNLDVSGVQGNTEDLTDNEAPQKVNGAYNYNPINAALNSHLRDININEKIAKELKTNNDAAVKDNHDSLAIDDRGETGTDDVQANNNAVVTDMKSIEPNYGEEEIVGEGIRTESVALLTDNEDIQANRHDVSGVQGNTEEPSVNEGSWKINGAYNYNPINKELNSHLRKMDINKKIAEELKTNSDAALKDSDDALTIDDDVFPGNESIQRESDASETDNVDMETNHDDVFDAQGNTEEPSLDEASSEVNGAYNYHPINEALNDHLREVNINEKIAKGLETNNHAGAVNDAPTEVYNGMNTNEPRENEAFPTTYGNNHPINEEVNAHMREININEKIANEMKTNNDAALMHNDDTLAYDDDVEDGSERVSGNTDEAKANEASPTRYDHKHPTNKALNAHLHEVNINEKITKDLEANNDATSTGNADGLANIGDAETIDKVSPERTDKVDAAIENDLEVMDNILSDSSKVKDDGIGALDVVPDAWDTDHYYTDTDTDAAASANLQKSVMFEDYDVVTQRLDGEAEIAADMTVNHFDTVVDSDIDIGVNSDVIDNDLETIEEIIKESGEVPSVNGNNNDNNNNNGQSLESQNIDDSINNLDVMLFSKPKVQIQPPVRKEPEIPRLAPIKTKPEIPHTAEIQNSKDEAALPVQTLPEDTEETQTEAVVPLISVEKNADEVYPGLPHHDNLVDVAQQNQLEQEEMEKLQEATKEEIKPVVKGHSVHVAIPGYDGQPSVGKVKTDHLSADDVFLTIGQGTGPKEAIVNELLATPAPPAIETTSKPGLGTYHRTSIDDEAMNKFNHWEVTLLSLSIIVLIKLTIGTALFSRLQDLRARNKRRIIIKSRGEDPDVDEGGLMGAAGRLLSWYGLSPPKAISNTDVFGSESDDEDKPSTFGKLKGVFKFGKKTGKSGLPPPPKRLYWSSGSKKKPAPKPPPPKVQKKPPPPPPKSPSKPKPPPPPSAPKPPPPKLMEKALPVLNALKAVPKPPPPPGQAKPPPPPGKAQAKPPPPPGKAQAKPPPPPGKAQAKPPPPPDKAQAKPPPPPGKAQAKPPPPTPSPQKEKANPPSPPKQEKPKPPPSPKVKAKAPPPPQKPEPVQKSPKKTNKPPPPTGDGKSPSPKKTPKSPKKKKTPSPKSKPKPPKIKTGPRPPPPLPKSKSPPAKGQKKNAPRIDTATGFEMPY